MGKAQSTYHRKSKSVLINYGATFPYRVINTLQIMSKNVSAETRALYALMKMNQIPFEFSYLDSEAMMADTFVVSDTQENFYVMGDFQTIFAFLRDFSFFDQYRYEPEEIPKEELPPPRKVTADFYEPPEEEMYIDDQIQETQATTQEMKYVSIDHEVQ